MNIGFIGYGEAAYNISMGFYEDGLRGVRATDTMLDHPVRGELIRRRAGEAHVELVRSAPELAKWADLIITVVPSAFVVDAARGVRDELAPGKIYADVSSSTAETKQKIWETIRDTGVLFADAALLGSVPVSKHRVPTLVSGNGAKAFQDAMTPWGMRISIVGDKPGAASAIKLIRSIYMKGVAALMVEMLQTADAYGVADEVVASVAESMDASPFIPTLNRLVTGTAIHCVRRGEELGGSVELVEEAGLNADIVKAAKRIHEELAPYNFYEKNAVSKLKNWQEVIEILRNEP